MKKGFSVGGIVFLAIIAIVFFKVVMPKINSVKDGAIGIAYAQEFETALKQIKEDFFLRGEFRDLRSMTTVRQFADDTLDKKIEVGKPIQFGVGVKSKGNMEWCAEMKLKQNGSKYVMETRDINGKKEICKEFHSMSLYQKLKTFEMN